MSNYKVLIVKIGAIGDVVMALPLAQYLKEVKGASITWVCGSVPAPILKAVNLIDELIVVDEAALLKGSFFSKCQQILKLWKRIGFKRWDLKITAHADPRYKVLALLSRATCHRFFQPSKRRASPIPGRYHGQEYLRLVCSEEGPSLPSPSMPLWSYPLQAQFAPLFLNSKVIALAPGGAKNILADDFQRRWPIEYYVKLARELLEQGYKVLVTGSKSDEWVSSYFEHLNVVNLIGHTSLPELVTLYQHCSFVVTHDSGPLHMAILAKSQTIALFGPTNPVERIPQAQAKLHMIWGGEKLPCRPCYDGKHFAACKNNQCMKSILPSQVLEIISQSPIDKGMVYSNAGEEVNK